MRWRIVLTLAALVLVLGAAAPAGRAATYDVWSCHGPDGSPVATTAWQPFGTIADATTRTDTCATGGSLTVQLSGSGAQGANGALTGFRFLLPDGVTPVSWQVQLTASAFGDGNPTGIYAAGVAVGQDPPSSVVAGCLDDSDCTVGDPAAPATRDGPLAAGDALAFVALCHSQSTACSPGRTPAARAQLFSSRVRLEDDAPPAVGALGGSAASGAPLRGRQSVTADVTDQGAGVQRTELLVDGASVARTDGAGRCAPPFTVALPCPDALRASFTLDADSLVPGAHRLAIRATDGAGQATTSAPLDVTVAPPDAPPAPTTVTVSTPAPPPPVDAAATETPLVARIAYASTRLRPGGGRRVAGTVFGADGRPLAGVALRVERRPPGGGDDAWRGIAATTTGADGRFALPPQSTSGEVRAVPQQDAAPGASLPSVLFVAPLDATAGTRDATLRNGQTLVMTGRVGHDGGAWAGRVALVQAVVRGRWTTVDDVTVGADGRWTWRYRFTSTTRTARYRFRVVLPATRDLPWPRLTTRTVGVLVRGAR